jgi:hypothetical protein
MAVVMGDAGPRSSQEKQLSRKGAKAQRRKDFSISEQRDAVHLTGEALH